VKRAFLVVLALGGIAYADGGTLRASRAAGPFVISIFTAPELLAVGAADVSALVQSRDDGAVVLDATIDLRLVGPDGVEHRLAATHAAATNHLLSAATVELLEAGPWRLEVTARRGAIAATVDCAFEVAAPTAGAGSHWPLLALPALCVALFFWRERLRRRG
jgi:hypothetical protein